VYKDEREHTKSPLGIARQPWLVLASLADLNLLSFSFRSNSAGLGRLELKMSH
jgi:hypothetical protein